VDVHRDYGEPEGARFGRKRRIEPIIEFTPTESRVLHGVRFGRSNKQIAFDLGIAETTVKAHMTALMRKLNVCNRTQVALACHALKMAPTLY